MKSTFVFVICFVIFFNYCPAQKIHFCDTTNRWVTSGYDSFNSRSVITYYKPSCCDTPFEWPVYSYTDIDVMEYDGTFEYGGTFSVREDTAAGILYWLNDMTIADEVFFDYNLVPGDLFHQHNVIDSNIIDSVVSLDSILIGSYYYRRWTMVELDTDYIHGFRGWRTVNTFVEGIGHLFAPTNRRSNDPSSTEFLRCFKHADTAVDFTTYYFCPEYGDTLYFLNECATVWTPQVVIPEKQISLSPNPAKTQITLFGVVNCAINIYDFTGREIANYYSQTENIDIDLSHFVSGLYLFRINSQGNSVIKKLIIEK